MKRVTQPDIFGKFLINRRARDDPMDRAVQDRLVRVIRVDDVEHFAVALSFTALYASENRDALYRGTRSQDRQDH